jgi:hypothetical protein
MQYTSVCNPFRLQKKTTSLKLRVISALRISVIADALDYMAAPIFSVPIIGDEFDAIVITLLYSITKSKISATINMIEFIPFIGDFLPVYTVSTMIWAGRESENIFRTNNKKEA